MNTKITNLFENTYLTYFISQVTNLSPWEHLTYFISQVTDLSPWKQLTYYPSKWPECIKAPKLLSKELTWVLEPPPWIYPLHEESEARKELKKDRNVCSLNIQRVHEL